MSKKKFSGNKRTKTSPILIYYQIFLLQAKIKKGNVIVQVRVSEVYRTGIISCIEIKAIIFFKSLWYSSTQFSPISLQTHFHIITHIYVHCSFIWLTLLFLQMSPTLNKKKSSSNPAMGQLVLLLRLIHKFQPKFQELFRKH